MSSGSLPSDLPVLMSESVSQPKPETNMSPASSPAHLIQPLDTIANKPLASLHGAIPNLNSPPSVYRTESVPLVTESQSPTISMDLSESRSIPIDAILKRSQNFDSTLPRANWLQAPFRLCFSDSLLRYAGFRHWEEIRLNPDANSACLR